ncbi:MAG: phage holin family protein [Actinobacteria bacterium]|nr:phage holin family protein [Actinomycetota bacterium]
MRYLGRFVANALAVFLALYLVDSIADGRFRVTAMWSTVLLSVALSFVNSSIRPLHRIRSRTARSLIVTVLTLCVNVLIVQIFVWVTPLEAANVAWVAAIAAFVTLLTGLVSWLIGFKVRAKGRSPSRSRAT